MAVATSDYLKPISFLIVDDRAYMRRVIKGILETLGCKHIDEAHNDSEALLPKMGGMELLKAVRADKGPLKFTPLIMITSETRRERVIMARNAGVTEYVAKPFNAKSLILRIREVVERPRPFVDGGIYFGPDRRRRSEVMSEGEDKRGQGSPGLTAKEDPREGLTQDQIDKLVAGGSIRDH